MPRARSWPPPVSGSRQPVNVVASGAITCLQAIRRGRRVPLPLIGPEWRIARTMSYLLGLADPRPRRRDAPPRPARRQRSDGRAARCRTRVDHVRGHRPALRLAERHPPAGPTGGGVMAASDVIGLAADRRAGSAAVLELPLRLVDEPAGVVDDWGRDAGLVRNDRRPRPAPLERLRRRRPAPPATQGCADRRQRPPIRARADLRRVGDQRGRRSAGPLRRPQRHRAARAARPSHRRAARSSRRARSVRSVPANSS